MSTFDFKPDLLSVAQVTSRTVGQQASFTPNLFRKMWSLAMLTPCLYNVLWQEMTSIGRSAETAPRRDSSKPFRYVCVRKDIGLERLDASDGCSGRFSQPRRHEEGPEAGPLLFAYSLNGRAHGELSLSSIGWTPASCVSGKNFEMSTICFTVRSPKQSKQPVGWG